MKDDFSIYIFIACLFAIFFIVSLLVYLNRGKNAALISKKLKLGAAIIAITGAASTGCETRTCYEPMPYGDKIEVNQYNKALYDWTINLPKDKKLNGQITERQSAEFSFIITDTASSKEFQSDDIMPSDGGFDEETEEFSLIISDSIKAGEYFIKFFNSGKNDSVKSYFITQYRLLITE